jgi:hypothetical protein
MVLWPYESIFTTLFYFVLRWPFLSMLRYVEGCKNKNVELCYFWMPTKIVRYEIPPQLKRCSLCYKLFLVKHKMFGLLCSDEPISAWRCMDEAAVSFGEDITRINCWRHRLGQWMGLGLPCYYLWHLFYEGKLEIWDSCAQYLLTLSRVCFLNAWGSLEPNNIFQITLLRMLKKEKL